MVYNVAYQQENERERSEHSFSPDKLTSDRQVTSKKVAYQQENERERSEHSFSPDKLTNVRGAKHRRRVSVGERGSAKHMSLHGRKSKRKTAAPSRKRTFDFTQYFINILNPKMEERIYYGAA